MRVVDKLAATDTSTIMPATAAGSNVLSFASFPELSDFAQGAGTSLLNPLSSAGLPDDVVADGLPDASLEGLADEMAGDGHRTEKFILDIPYSVLSSVIQSLDADKGWENLAADAGYTFEKIRLLELEGVRPQGSPTRCLLWELGSRNTTVRQLYGRLSNIHRYREMKILEDYVNSAVPTPTSSINNNSLKGLKSQDPPDNNKGVPPGKKEGGSCGSLCSDSINFNQPKSGFDSNTSPDFQKEKHYSGKKIPGNSKVPTNESMVWNATQSMRTNQNTTATQNDIRPPAMTPAPSVRKAPSCLPSSSVSSSASPVSASTSSSSSLLSSTSSLSASRLISMDNIIDSSAYRYTEILTATNNFCEANKIGEGAFGIVYFGVLRHINCAVKKMAEANSTETTVERSAQVRREMTYLLKFRHENLVTLYGYALDGPSLCLIYQFMPNGSLEDRLMCKKNTAALTWAQRLNIMAGASRGLHFLHTMREQPLVHGDIKSANILLDKNFEARIGDLGQAEQATSCEKSSPSQRHTHITRAQAATKLYGTKAYQPHEVLSGGNLSIKGDVFAMGVVLLEVYSGEQAYDQRREGGPFLAAYFQNKMEECEHGESDLLSCLDARGGECPQDIALSMLQLALRSISHVKRARPDSTEFLKDITAVEDLYKSKYGSRSVTAESLPSSVRSCQVSHTSSPVSVGALDGAPYPQKQSPNSQPSSFPLYPGRNSECVVDNRLADVNQSAIGKHEPHLDNRLAANMDSSSVNFHNKIMPEVPSNNDDGVSNQNENSESTASGISPIELFPRNQPLPPAFRLQQAYDKQKNPDRKRISRLSNCHETRELNSEEDSNIPQADPAKLAELERFDRINLGEGQNEGALQSDPKKLAVLKQFDNNQQFVNPSCTSEHKALLPEDLNLECDPKKLACLKQFDQENMREMRPSVHDVPMVSDPKKLSHPQQREFLRPGKLGQSESCSSVSSPSCRPTTAESTPRPSLSGLPGTQPPNNIDFSLLQRQQTFFERYQQEVAGLREDENGVEGEEYDEFETLADEEHPCYAMGENSVTASEAFRRENMNCVPPYLHSHPAPSEQDEAGGSPS